MTGFSSIRAETHIPRPLAPADLVGLGDPSARVFGGLAGGAVGVGAAFGIATLTGKSSLRPVQIVGGVAALAAVGAGAWGGQKLLGTATRSTQAEVTRAAQAKQQDATIEYRATTAEFHGRLDKEQRATVDKLRKERIELAEARPETNVWGTWVVPIAAGVATAAVAGVLAAKFSPDDGKGITAMFNTMMAVPAGLAGGAWAGTEIGSIFLNGPHLDDVPTDAQQRIRAIDAQLDELLGAEPS